MTWNVATVRGVRNEDGYEGDWASLGEFLSLGAGKAQSEMTTGIIEGGSPGCDR
jgi:hypothetical protein